MNRGFRAGVVAGSSLALLTGLVLGAAQAVRLHESRREVAESRRRLESEPFPGLERSLQAFERDEKELMQRTNLISRLLTTPGRECPGLWLEKLTKSPALRTRVSLLDATSDYASGEAGSVRDVIDLAVNLQAQGFGVFQLSHAEGRFWIATTPHCQPPPDPLAESLEAEVQAMIKR